MKHVSRFGYHIFYKFLSVTYQDSNLCSICFSGNQQIRTWFYLRNVCGIDVSTFFQHCTSNTAVQFCCHNSYTKVAQSNSTFTDCQNSVSCVGHTIYFLSLWNFFGEDSFESKTRSVPSQIETVKAVGQMTLVLLLIIFFCSEPSTKHLVWQ